ncbi:MAG: TPM domain-containing protein [Cytophagales bacterium]|nr:TPM domain-containing protein [Cytophagales bacterium]
MFTEEEKQRIVEAIRTAERNTSGEVKVHAERQCPGDVMARAREVFVKLELHRTQLKNGVLFYIALDDHKFAILGDAGIHAVVPPDFWESTKELMRSHFRAGRVTDGLCAGIEKAGHELHAHFPYKSDDVNELSDDISFGD